MMIRFFYRASLCSLVLLAWGCDLKILTSDDAGEHTAPEEILGNSDAPDQGDTGSHADSTSADSTSAEESQPLEDASSADGSSVV